MAKLPRLRVAADHRILETTDAVPFFYLADTAWELFHRLTFEECDLYLRTRKHQGFNAYQAVALAEFDGLRTANRYGEMPLKDLDPLKPVEAYWEHLDKVIQDAGEIGLYTVLLPTWGDKWNKKWGAGPEIFNPDNARAYGAWIAKRYKDEDIIWMLGGDRPVETDIQKQIINAMAAGIRSVVGEAQLVTFHPCGRSHSSRFVHNEPWLDFNTIQSGHHLHDHPNWEMIAADLALTPQKPAMDSEPCYENHPVMDTPGGRYCATGQWFGAHDIRKASWRSALPGSCGLTYGCHDIWQFYDPGLTKPINHARTNWREAITLPGATQVQHVKKWMGQIGLPKRIGYAPEMVIDQADYPNAQFPVAGRAQDGSAAMIYLPAAGEYLFDLSSLRTPSRCTWISPETGQIVAQQPVESASVAIENEGPLDAILLIE